MKACPCLAGVAALALAVAVAAPAPVRAEPPAPRGPRERDHSSPYAHSAIGAVIDANGGNVPATGAELTAALDKLGGFVQLPVPFSAVALDSGLRTPRVVLTARAEPPEPRPQGGGWGGWGGPPPAPDFTGVNHTRLEGRLFLAANTEVRRGGVGVRAVEFISWNSRKLKFDFGVIDDMGRPAGGRPEVRLLDGVRCFSCHKNRGPILGVGPWSNTMHNELIHDAAADAIGDSLLRSPLFTDGIDHFTAHAFEVDAAVRQGGDLLRDRAVFKHLAATADGRKALVLLVDAVLTPGPLREHDKRIKKELDALALGEFLGNARLARQAAFPSELLDFNPAGRLNKENAEWTLDKLNRYAEARAAGRHNLPPDRVPSNPKAFVRPPTKAFRNPSDVLSAELLARTVGLTEADRLFLAGLTGPLSDAPEKPGPVRRAVVTQVLTGPQFADLMTTGTLPDRDDFKDRFVAGLAEERKLRPADDHPGVNRGRYTSTPKIDPRAKPEKEPVAIPSHACLACHDIRGAKPAAFNPIPPLAFDPFDATARAAWLKSADRKKQAEVLARLVKRLGTDKDMPPEDSAEHELYRAKDPAALNAVKDWLDAERKKVK